VQLKLSLVAQNYLKALDLHVQTPSIEYLNGGFKSEAQQFVIESKLEAVGPLRACGSGLPTPC
jgi:hypothetical protein